MAVSEAPNVLTIALKRFRVFVLHSKNFFTIQSILYAYLIFSTCVAVWKIWEA